MLCLDKFLTWLPVCRPHPLLRMRGLEMIEQSRGAASGEPVLEKMLGVCPMASLGSIVHTSVLGGPNLMSAGLDGARTLHSSHYRNQGTF